MYQGKGEVIRRAFDIIDADIYILIDGDNECDASAIPRLVNFLIEEKLDIVTVVRKDGTYRKGHSFGNKMITNFAKVLFGKYCNDILSGYRIFSNKFVKSLPVLSKCFEIEAEYKSRPEGSFSKLHTFRDGFKIINLIINLLMNQKPIVFWTSISSILTILGLYYGIPVIYSFIKEGFVPVATNVLSTSFIILSAISSITGLIMNATVKAVKEIRRYRYLSIK